MPNKPYDKLVTKFPFVTTVPLTRREVLYQSKGGSQFVNNSLNMHFGYSLTKLEVGTKLEVRTKVKVGTKLKVCLVITFVENKNQTRFAFKWGRGQFNVA